jgi:hypothetical protein
MDERMKKRPPITAVFSALLVGFALVSTAAFADSGRGGRGGDGMGHRGRPPGSHGHGGHHGGRPPSSHHHGFHHGSKAHRSFNHHGFRHHHGGRSFFSWGVGTVYIPPLYYGYGGLPYYSGPPAYSYSGPPPYYGPNYSVPWTNGPRVGGSVSVAVAPPTPSTIQYPNGRWELSGDGMTTPYTWVWIPNPPPPPPAPPPAPPEEPSGEQPTSGSRLPSSPTQIYRWIDEQGVVHLTNRADAVPTMYRTQAKSTPRP